MIATQKTLEQIRDSLLKTSQYKQAKTPEELLKKMAYCDGVLDMFNEVKRQKPYKAV